MKIQKKANVMLLLGSGLIFTSCPVRADIETTTIKTTTVSDGNSPSTLLDNPSTVTTETVVPGNQIITLPATATYQIIDPITGAVKGNYDPMHNAVDIKTVGAGSVVIDQATGRIMATISPSGQIVDLGKAPANDPLVAAIDKRRAELEQRILSCSSQGTIDAKESSALRAELDKVATQEASAKQSSGALSYADAFALSLALNNLSNRLVLLANGPVLTPLLGSRIVSQNGQVVVVDPVTYRRLQLTQRVDDEYAAGRLSAKQVAELKEQLNNVSYLDSRYRKNGQLDETKSARLAAKLDNVESRLTRDVASINDKRAKIGLTVQ